MDENQKVKKAWYKKWWVWVIAFIVITSIVSNMNKNEDNIAASNTPTEQTQQSPSPKEDVLEVDYETLHSDYMANPINADKQYKGKLMKLTGVIDNIDREISQETYITFHVGDKYSFQNIRLTFKKSEEDKIASLSKGQKVTVIGKCNGTLLSNTVALKDCYLAE